MTTPLLTRLKNAWTRFSAPTPPAVSAESQEYFTTLCRDGDVDEIYGILRHYADAPQWKDSTGRTGMLHAAYKGHIHVIDALIEYRAPITQQAIEYARRGGHENIAEYLEEKITRAPAQAGPQSPPSYMGPCLRRGAKA